LKGPLSGPKVTVPAASSSNVERLQSAHLQLQVALAVRVRAGDAVVRGATRSLYLKVLLVPSRDILWQGIPMVLCGLSRYKIVLGTTHFWWHTRSHVENRMCRSSRVSNRSSPYRRPVRSADFVGRMTLFSATVRQASFDLQGRASSCPARRTASAPSGRRQVHHDTRAHRR